MSSKRLLGAIAVLAAVPATAAIANSDAKTTRQIHVTMKQTAMHLADAAPSGDSPGDIGVISGDLLRPGSQAKVGSYQGTCVLIAPATGNSECTFTLKLAGGQIDVLGGYGKGINAEGVVHEAVIGGTGEYSHARGQTTGRETGDTTVDVKIAWR